jgi:hypothetical protein
MYYLVMHYENVDCMLMEWRVVEKQLRISTKFSQKDDIDRL